MRSKAGKHQLAMTLRWLRKGDSKPACGVKKCKQYRYGCPQPIQVSLPCETETIALFARVAEIAATATALFARDSVVLVYWVVHRL